MTIHEAKTQLSKLITEVEAGEDVIIARCDKPVVRLVKVGPKTVNRVLGFGVKPDETPPKIDRFDDPDLDRLVAKDFEDSLASEKWKTGKDAAES